MNDGAFRWRNLTTEVDDKRSPLRQHLNARFPNLRSLQDEYKASAGELLVPPRGAHAGTLGAAFDLAVRYALQPAYVADIAFIGFMSKGLPAMADEVRGVAQAAQTFSPLSDDMMRACWALALCTEVTRVGVIPGSPLAELIHSDRFSASVLLELADSAAIEDLVSLSRLADGRLLQHIRRSTPMILGPTFAGSHHCPADADLIAGRSLIDLKCTIGKKRSSGARYIALDRTVIYQLVAYALFDYIDEYDIDTIGLYSARYGHFIQWSLLDALERLAGRAVSLAEERGLVQGLLVQSA